MNNLPYQEHSETSKEAAEKKINAKDLRKAILNMIDCQGFSGLTNDEISMRLGKNSSFYSPRLIELERAGDIAKLQETRKTRSNRNANVYVVPRSVLSRPVIHVKKIGKMPDPMIEEADKMELRLFIHIVDSTDIASIRSASVPKGGAVYNAIKRLAGV